jgi:DNA modification methylase
MASEDDQQGIHSIHIYPARMVPQVARDLIKLYGREGEPIGDLSVGSGTVAVEALKLGYDMVCADTNPLAQLLTKVKTTYLDPSILEDYRDVILKAYHSSIVTPDEVEKAKEIIPRVEYWFKPAVIEDLIRVRKAIAGVDNPTIKDFFNVCFSVTVRKASNVRTREFKLYRRSKDELKTYSPNVLAIFSSSIKKGILGMSYIEEIEKTPIILDEDGRKTTVGSNSLGMILTSPPYGDSSTTVAYGQFSKYPLLWLGYDITKVREIDQVSFGGKASGDGDVSSVLRKSESLNNVAKLVRAKDEDRSNVLSRFFRDLDDGLKEMRRVLKDGRFCIIIIGNRTMRGIRVPTIDITKELTESGWTIEGRKKKFECLDIKERHIYQKRLPYVGAPQGRTGQWEPCDLIMNEGIIVLKSV